MRLTSCTTQRSCSSRTWSDTVGFRVQSGSILTMGKTAVPCVGFAQEQNKTKDISTVKKRSFLTELIVINYSTPFEGGLGHISLATSVAERVRHVLKYF